MMVSRSIILRMRSVSGKSCSEETHFLFFQNSAVCEKIMCKNVVETDRVQMTTAHALCILDN